MGEPRGSSHREGMGPMSGECNVMKAEHFSRRRETVEGWEVDITAYQIGDDYYCHVDNASPGATIARGQGRSKAEAEVEAMAKARARLQQTRVPTVR